MKILVVLAAFVWTVLGISLPGHPCTSGGEDHDGDILQKDSSPDAVEEAVRKRVDASWDGPEQAAFLAVKDNNVTALSLLDRSTVGRFLHSTDDLGYTPLHVAAMYNCPDAAQWLLEHGSGTSDIQREGWMPLHTAARFKSLAVVKVLLDHGADVNQKTTQRGFSPLHVAAQNNALDVAKFLVLRGANINALDNQHEIPLHAAAFHDSVDVLKFLINRGGSMVARDEAGNSPLHWAAENGSLQAAKKLVLLEANRRAKDAYGRTPLDDARGQPELERVLDYNA